MDIKNFNKYWKYITHFVVKYSTFYRENNEEKKLPPVNADKNTIEKANEYYSVLSSFRVIYISKEEILTEYIKPLYKLANNEEEFLDLLRIFGSSTKVNGKGVNSDNLPNRPSLIKDENGNIVIVNANEFTGKNYNPENLEKAKKQYITRTGKRKVITDYKPIVEYHRLPYADLIKFQNGVYKNNGEYKALYINYRDKLPMVRQFVEEYNTNRGLIDYQSVNAINIESDKKYNLDLCILNFLILTKIKKVSCEIIRNRINKGSLLVNNNFVCVDPIYKEVDDKAGTDKKTPKIPLTFDNSSVTESIKHKKVIIITESCMNCIKDNLKMTEYKFKSNIKQFLHDLLNDPTIKSVPNSLRQCGINRTKLINELEKMKIINKKQKINDKDENGEPKTATMKIKYIVPKKDFDRKLKKLYIKFFEKNLPEKKHKVNEDGEGATSCDASSGQYSMPLFQTPIRRKIK